MTSTPLTAPPTDAGADAGAPVPEESSHGDRPVTIRFDDVGKRFDDRWIVEGLDVEIHAGTIVGMVGPSGCGKTTTVRLATGVYRPDSGEVSVLGRAPSGLSTAERVAIGYLPQSPVLFDDLSLWENLNFHASLNGVRWRRRARLREVLSLVDLDGEERKLVRDSSGGMKRRLSLAATLVHDPPILILDEPTAGIDPLLRRQIWDHFRSLRDAGRTVVVTTQHVNEAAHCDVVVVLDEGRVVTVGSPAELRRQAFGGDLLELAIDGVIEGRIVDEIDQLDHVTLVETLDAHRVRVTVHESSPGMAAVLERLTAIDVDVTESGEVPVDWDETFIALIERDDRSEDR